MRTNSSPCRIVRLESHNRRAARGPEIVYDAPCAALDAYAAVGRLRRRMRLSAAAARPHGNRDRAFVQVCNILLPCPHSHHPSLIDDLTGHRSTPVLHDQLARIPSTWKAVTVGMGFRSCACATQDGYRYDGRGKSQERLAAQIWTVAERTGATMAWPRSFAVRRDCQGGSGGDPRVQVNAGSIRRRPARPRGLQRALAAVFERHPGGQGD